MSRSRLEQCLALIVPLVLTRGAAPEPRHLFAELLYLNKRYPKGVDAASRTAWTGRHELSCTQSPSGCKLGKHLLQLPLSYLLVRTRRSAIKPSLDLLDRDLVSGRSALSPAPGASS